MALYATSEYKVSEKAYNAARHICSKISSQAGRKRAFKALICMDTLADYLYSQGYKVDISKNLYKIAQINEEFEFTDIHYNGRFINVLPVVNGKFVLIPKIHYYYETIPDLYVVADYSQTTKKVKILGCIEGNNVDKSKQNDKYYITDINNLQTPDIIEERLNVIKLNDLTENNHDIIHSFFIDYIDGAILTEDNKQRLITHLIECKDCRNTLVEYYDYETIVKNTKKYPDVFADHTLDIVGAAAVNDEKYKDYEEITLEIDKEPDEYEEDEETTINETGKTIKPAVDDPLQLLYSKGKNREIFNILNEKPKKQSKSMLSEIIQDIEKEQAEDIPQKEISYSGSINPEYYAEDLSEGFDIENEQKETQTDSNTKNIETIEETTINEEKQEEEYSHLSRTNAEGKPLYLEDISALEERVEDKPKFTEKLNPQIESTMSVNDEIILLDDAYDVDIPKFSETLKADTKISNQEPIDNEEIIIIKEEKEEEFPELQTINEEDNIPTAMDGLIYIDHSEENITNDNNIIPESLVVTEEDLIDDNILEEEIITEEKILQADNDITEEIEDNYNFEEEELLHINVEDIDIIDEKDLEDYLNNKEIKMPSIISEDSVVATNTQNDDFMLIGDDDLTQETPQEVVTSQTIEDDNDDFMLIGDDDLILKDDEDFSNNTQIETQEQKINSSTLETADDDLLIFEEETTQIQEIDSTNISKEIKTIEKTEQNNLDDFALLEDSGDDSSLLTFDNDDSFLLEEDEDDLIIEETPQQSSYISNYSSDETTTNPLEENDEEKYSESDFIRPQGASYEEEDEDDELVIIDDDNPEAFMRPASMQNDFVRPASMQDDNDFVRPAGIYSAKETNEIEDDDDFVIFDDEKEIEDEITNKFETKTEIENEELENNQEEDMLILDDEDEEITQEETPKKAPSQLDLIFSSLSEREKEQINKTQSSAPKEELKEQETLKSTITPEQLEKLRNGTLFNDELTQSQTSKTKVFKDAIAAKEEAKEAGKLDNIPESIPADEPLINTTKYDDEDVEYVYVDDEEDEETDINEYLANDKDFEDLETFDNNYDDSNEEEYPDDEKILSEVSTDDDKEIAFSNNSFEQEYNIPEEEYINEEKIEENLEEIDDNDESSEDEDEDDDNEDTSKNKKGLIKKISIIIAVIVVLAGIGFGAKALLTKDKTPTEQTTQQTLEAGAVTEGEGLSVPTGEEGGLAIPTEEEGGLTIPTESTPENLPQPPAETQTIGGEEGGLSIPEQPVKEPQPQAQPIPQAEPAAKAGTPQTTTEDMNKAVTNAFSENPTAISISKISWGVSSTLASDTALKQYLKTVGKIIKNNTQKNIASVKGVTPNSATKVQIIMNESGTLQDVIIVKSSGTTQIDNVVLQSVKQAVNSCPMPILAETTLQANEQATKSKTVKMSLTVAF